MTVITFPDGSVLDTWRGWISQGPEWQSYAEAFQQLIALQCVALVAMSAIAIFLLLAAKRRGQPKC